MQVTYVFFIFLLTTVRKKRKVHFNTIFLFNPLHVKYFNVINIKSLMK